MKKLASLLFLFFTLFVQAQTADELFLEANNHYKNGAYKNAIAQYENIEKLGVTSSDLYFNLGNCYYKLNKVAPAIYHYEKALKINANHREAAENLTFAKRMTIDVIEALPKTIFQRFSENTFQKLSFERWAIIAVIASFLVALFFLLYRFSKSSKKKLFYFNTTILSAVLLIMSVFFAYSNLKTITKNRPAIIFATKTEIKNAPTTSGETVFELHEGTKVFVLDALDRWKKIKIADGKTGWIATDDLKEI